MTWLPCVWHGVLEHVWCMGKLGPVTWENTGPHTLAHLHELNNPDWRKTEQGKWNFPTWPGEKAGAEPGGSFCPTMSSHKNGYKKIRGCLGSPVVKLINPSNLCKEDSFTTWVWGDLKLRRVSHNSYTEGMLGAFQTRYNISANSDLLDSSAKFKSVAKN